MGSFLNVLIERSIEERNWIRGRSACDFCGHKLAWYDNIPLLSFVFLKGRCRYCRKKIHPSHILMEVLTGVLFVWWFWGGFIILNIFRLVHQPFRFVQPLFWLLVAVLLLVIVVYDLRYLLIPDWTLWLLLSLTLFYRVMLVLGGVMQVEDLVKSLVAAALAAGFLSFLWLITLGKGMGLGDVKLIIPLSLLVSWRLVLLALVGAFIVGAVSSLALLFFGRLKWQKPVPFGPYLVVGFLTVLFFGDQILNWYLSWFML